MPQHIGNSTSLHSMGGLYGDLQIVASSEHVLLDVSARQYDTEGRLHRQHALASLPLTDARRLRDLLDAAIEAAEDADPRQPGLWSQATTQHVAARTARRGRLT